MTPPASLSVSNQPPSQGASTSRQEVIKHFDPRLVSPGNTNRLVALERQNGKATAIVIELSRETKEVLKTVQGFSSFAPADNEKAQSRMKELLSGTERNVTLKALYEIATIPCADAQIRKDALTLLFSVDEISGIRAAVKAAQGSTQMFQPAMSVLRAGAMSANAETKSMSEAAIQLLNPPKTAGEKFETAGAKLREVWQTKALPAMQWTVKAARAAVDWKIPRNEGCLNAQDARAALESGLDPINFNFIPQTNNAAKK